MSIGDTFSGAIYVASRIVDQLSSGLYESPAACLKELLNNSYDADASLVEVFIKPDADRIIIEDDGEGMSQADFIKHFSHISESYKRELSDRTRSGREKIGKIGIGFIAANEICDTMEIHSTKSGSRELLRVRIHFDRMREDPAKRRRDGGSFEKGDYEGEIDQADSASHFTRIVLKRIRPDAQSMFAGIHNRSIDTAPLSLYGLGVEETFEALSSPHLTSWSQFDSYSQNMLRVALNIPVRYFDHWMPAGASATVSAFSRRARSLDFRVSYDGSELCKPIVLRPPEGKRFIVRRFKHRGPSVSADGYFYAQHGVIRPRDLQGLLLRVREAAVGDYDPTFLDFPPSEGSLIQRWISAEVWADDRLEDAMNIDRKTLRISHPAYVELQNAIHAELRDVISDARARIYSTGNQERQQKSAAASVGNIVTLIEGRLGQSDPRLAAQLVDVWSGRGGASNPREKALLRKYSVAQLYDVVLEVAEATLPADLLRRFLRKLTERLGE